MDTTLNLPPQLEDAVQAEAEAYGYDETATRWLILLLQSDPTLPAPTAGAMVARVRQLPIGADLAALDVTLQGLSVRNPIELTTSERRVTAMLLKDLVSQAHALLAATIAPPHHSALFSRTPVSTAMVLLTVTCRA